MPFVADLAAGQVTGLLFLNARAGTFSAADEAEFRRRAAGHGLQIVEVTRDLDVAATIRQALSSGIRKFVVAGGDGSLHYVAQALVHTDGVLGIVPLGSVNHLARDLDLPVGDWRAALDIAVNGNVRQIDVGSVNGRYFLNSAMIGITPTISEYRERFRSVHNRFLAYVKAIRVALHQFPHVTLVIEHDGRVETLRTQLFSVAVNSYDLTQAGLVAKKATFNDGRVTMYSLAFMGRLQFIRAIAKYLRGRAAEVEGFRSIRTTSLRVDTGRRRLRFAVDGEVIELPTPLQIAAVPAALLVRFAD
jgi:diacylglycerol kinase family enzyme